MFKLLISAFACQRKTSYLGERMATETREFLLEEITALRLMSNEIVLQLCNLDDKDGNWTLLAMKREVLKGRKTVGSTKVVNRLAQDFRTALNNLKVKHRNTYIAHNNADAYPNPFDLPDFNSDFRQLTQQAIRLFEHLWGSQVSFEFRPGAVERTIDLKRSLQFEDL
jgi:hypothetical protein